ncbi:MAG: ATP-binding cassette domain-containing protein, partial [Oscillospiraceae bacterium]|nr:ATP-binding cassette domain-containing protein [Oscillospiraceae bacterium]
MSELLKVSGLVKRYAQVRALNELDLTLEPGRIVGLLGPNGSGKTTLIKLLSNILTADSGTIEIAGQPPGIATKALVSYLPERTYLPGWMSGEEVIAFFADFYEDFNIAKAYEMLERLGIDKKL